MAKNKLKSLTNGNHDYLEISVSPGYSNTPEKQDFDVKSYLMMLVEDLKVINNSLKEIQENTAKKVEALKEETQKSLKDLQKNRAKQVEVLKEETQKSLKNYRKTQKK
jgi:ferritin-like protein